MMNPFSLQGKNIFVTGASSGIGRAVAIACAQMGASLVITDINELRLLDTYHSLEGQGHANCLADLTNEDEIKTLVNNLNHLDGVVHCAGINKKIPVSGLTEKNIFML